jgi:hypothetical protein
VGSKKSNLTMVQTFLWNVINASEPTFLPLSTFYVYAANTKNEWMSYLQMY